MREMLVLFWFSFSLFLFISLITPWGHDFMLPFPAKFIMGVGLAGNVAISSFFILIEFLGEASVGKHSKR